MQVNLVSPPPYQLHRISRTPFVPPRWEFAHKDDEPQPGTFGGRFDDPRKPWGIPDSERFRMFYCAKDRICSFIECVQYIKQDPDPHSKTAESLDAFAQRVNSLVPDDSHEAPVTRETLGPTTAQAALAAWAKERRIAATYLNDDVTFVDLEGDETLTSLNSVAVLMALAKKHGHPSITIDTVRDTCRELTQAIAYILYQVAARNVLPVAGIRYISRFSEVSAPWECWALFDTRIDGHHTPGPDQIISPYDSDLIEAAVFHHIL